MYQYQTSRAAISRRVVLWVGWLESRVFITSHSHLSRKQTSHLFRWHECRRLDDISARANLITVIARTLLQEVSNWIVAAWTAIAMTGADRYLVIP